MGLAGSIKSVSATHQTFMQQPVQPDGPTIVYPLFCEECEFDRDGNQVRSGLLDNGHFRGDLKREVRDDAGRVQQEVWENEKGEVTSRHVYTNGPVGKVQDDFYLGERLFNTTTFRYDSRGNVIESNGYKPDGTLDSHNEATFDERGNQLESVSAGPGDIYYHAIQTYNSKSGNLESFTSLNRDGSVRLRFRVNEDTVVSFWQQAGDKRTYGSGICFADDDGTERDCRDYDSDGSYNTTHYTFTDKTKRNPLRVTLYDSGHRVIMEAEYEYEMDAFRNWTKRTIWIRTGDTGERQLLEKDTRTLTYYPDSVKQR
jgi:hypothetical protein